MIREDICQSTELEEVELYNKEGCGYLCRSDKHTAPKGCHIIALAMVFSYLKNGGTPVDLGWFNDLVEHNGKCDLLWIGDKLKDYEFGLTADYKPYYSYKDIDGYDKSKLSYKKGFSKINLALPNPEKNKKLYSDSIRGALNGKNLEKAAPVIMQIEYLKGGKTQNYHAFPIVGINSDGKYLIQDEFYGFGEEYTTLDNTFNTILEGKADEIRITKLIFFYLENFNPLSDELTKEVKSFSE